MVQGKTEKGYYVPLSDLSAPEISIILEYVFPLIWKTVNKQICSSKKVSQMKAILLLQTVSISKILDVETDNVATAGSSEMRRGDKEKFLRGKKTLQSY